MAEPAIRAQDVVAVRGEVTALRGVDFDIDEHEVVAVVAALAARPRLLLADEPTGELDASTSAALIALIRDLARSDRATVVVVTHDLAVAAGCERALTIRDGRLVAERRGADGEVAV